MRSFWYPLSALLVPDPPALATPLLLSMLLRAGKRIELLYAGDRMWPTVRHGQRVTVESARAESMTEGTVVVGCPGGIPDLFRVVRGPAGTVRLQGDADPHEAFTVAPDAVLARACLEEHAPHRLARAVRRLYLDLREALIGRPDFTTSPAPREPDGAASEHGLLQPKTAPRETPSGADPAGTVRAKYEAQAPFYAGLGGAGMSERLLESFRERVAPAGRVLVAGSGTGRESFALTRAGWSVTGVDFSPAMVEIARREAVRQGLAPRFLLADLRTHEERPGTLAAVYFTYDVYSFIPRRTDRVALLERMSRWLAPGGVVFLSARRIGRPYDPCILTLQWIARRAERAAAPDAHVEGEAARWGQSHTRWNALDGTLRRSFVQVFTNGALRKEIEEGGFTLEAWHGNHGILAPAKPPP